MTLLQENVFRITDHLWRESTDDRWIPHEVLVMCGFAGWRQLKHILWW